MLWCGRGLSMRFWSGSVNGNTWSILLVKRFNLSQQLQTNTKYMKANTTLISFHISLSLSMQMKMNNNSVWKHQATLLTADHEWTVYKVVGQGHHGKHTDQTQVLYFFLCFFFSASSSSPPPMQSQTVVTSSFSGPTYTWPPFELLVSSPRRDDPFLVVARFCTDGVPRGEW